MTERKVIKLATELTHYAWAWLLLQIVNINGLSIHSTFWGALWLVETLFIGFLFFWYLGRFTYAVKYYKDTKNR